MKILHIITDILPGGKERQLVEILKGFKDSSKFKHEIVLFENRIFYDEIFKLRQKIYIINRNHKSCFYAFFNLIRICKTLKPDIIQTWGFKPTLYSIPIAKMLNIKLLNFSIQYALPIRKFTKLWLYGKLTFLFSDMVIANSKAGLETHNLTESKKYRYVYNGFDFNRISSTHPEKIKDKLGIKAEFVVGMVASFTKAKDYYSLVQGGINILEKSKNVNFIFVGDGPERQDMEETIAKKYYDKFYFLGQRNDVEEIIKVFDVGILLSKVGHSEGISNSIMEYMAFEKPVIATKTGGNNELIIDGKTGLLIKHNDINTLTDNINMLLNNKKLRREIGKNGKNRLKKMFNLEKMVSEFIKIYEDLAKD